MLQSIDFFSISFHIIVINFIFAFFEIKKSLDFVMSITCKFFKRMTLIFDQTKRNVSQWIQILLAKFDVMNWKLSKQIISDRNRKFFNDFWNALFIKLKMKLLYNTAYHFQTDDQSKQINQIAKIALKYHLIILKCFTTWSKILLTIQRKFNNIVSTTNRIFNKTIYEFISITAFSFHEFVFESSNHFFVKWMRQKIFDVITFF